MLKYPHHYVVRTLTYQNRERLRLAKKKIPSHLHSFLSYSAQVWDEETEIGKTSKNSCIRVCENRFMSISIIY